MGSSWREEKDQRLARWYAAEEAGDPVELAAAFADLPSAEEDAARGSAELLADPLGLDASAREALARVKAEQRTKRRKKKASARRKAAKSESGLDGTALVERVTMPPSSCARCGAALVNLKATGRPRTYCSDACRKAAFEDRRAHVEGAVKVQVVERLVTEIRERKVQVPHPPKECVATVLADDDTVCQVVEALTGILRLHAGSRFTAGSRQFARLRHGLDELNRAVAYRVASDDPTVPAWQPEGLQSVPVSSPTNQ
jgi:hypothetical protein